MTTTQRFVGTSAYIISENSSTKESLEELLTAYGAATRGEPGTCVSDSPHVVLIDIHTKLSWCFGIVTSFRCAPAPCAAVALLNTNNRADIARALSVGAFDCVPKPFEQADLLDAVASAISCTKRWRSRLESGTAPTAQPEPHETPQPRADRPPRRPQTDRIEELCARLGHAHKLTVRERQVLSGLLTGHRYDDIAMVLGVAPRTAKYHAANLLRKLELDSRHDLPRLLTRFR